MTLKEAHEVLAGAAWGRKAPLVALFDELVEQHNKPLFDSEGKRYPGKIERAFMDHTLGYVASGRVVQLLVSLRQQNGMPLYEVAGA